MGKIQVGQKNPKTVDMGGFTVVPKKVKEIAVPQQQSDQSVDKAEAREQRLAEIKAMPVEAQLSLLLEEGFEGEAKELSERLAFGQEEQTDEGTDEENQGTEVQTDGTEAELNVAGDEPTEPAESAVKEPKKATTTKKTTKTKGTSMKK